ncbi:MAG: restriction endonuclease [Gammaproteobacteria bacterium]|nr:restriction endonuclease [Gammaproteobacteria bacterium]
MSLVRPEVEIWKGLEAERIGHLLDLALGSSVDEISRHAQELAIADAANLAQSYRVMTGADLLFDHRSSSAQEVLNQVLGASSAASVLANTFDQFAVPDHVQHVIDELTAAKRFLGEFEYSSEVFSSDEPAHDDYESQDAEEALDTRREVESRIIQVGHFPAKVFEALSENPELIRGLSPREFEELTAELLDRLGFQGIQLTPRSGDGGRDVVATKRVNDIPIIMAFECKRYSQNNKIGLDIMRSLLGTITHGPTRASMGVVVTTSSFTSGAKKFIATEATVDGKDFDSMVKWLQSVRHGGNGS